MKSDSSIGEKNISFENDLVNTEMKDACELFESDKQIFVLVFKKSNFSLLNFKKK